MGSLPESQVFINPLSREEGSFFHTIYRRRKLNNKELVEDVALIGQIHIEPIGRYLNINSPQFNSLVTRDELDNHRREVKLAVMRQYSEKYSYENMLFADDLDHPTA